MGKHPRRLNPKVREWVVIAFVVIAILLGVVLSAYISYLIFRFPEIEDEMFQMNLTFWRYSL